MHTTKPGRAYPPGVSVDREGVNFAIFSRHAEAVELRLYQSAVAAEPFEIIRLDPDCNRTFFIWHVFVSGLGPGTWYAWRLEGPADTRVTGFRFNARKELADPWARTVTTAGWDRLRAAQPETSSTAPRAMIVADDYDWEGDSPVDHPYEETIIYELHVGGFTRHPSSDVSRPGTFLGLIEKIPYLQQLGITDVELLPVMAFDEQDVPEKARSLGLRNYWGYSTHSFWSPHPGYCLTPEQGSHRREFCDLVKALHRAGIGVILDVVFNHTAEGGATGPWINFKGIGNETFYHLDPADKRCYRDYTGCGNSVNCNHPVVAAALLDCLEYWVRELHVDGFRFDLASAMSRGEDGQPMVHPPLLWNIEMSRVLQRTKIIAEAWDAGGLYQVGGFPGYRWREWNGRYRDLARQFLRGQPGLIGELATRLAGSSDLYQPAGRLPTNSINFVTCHDGFTLSDLVSYQSKHNEANGEENRDGSDQNYSGNCGVEGETADPRILGRRRQRARNAMAVLLLSQGVPMVLFGDEVLRTQRGNNNAYCQDNELGWLDWRLVERNRDMLQFTRGMIALRRRHPNLRRRGFLTARDITWYGPSGAPPAWNDPAARFLAFMLGAVAPGEEPLYVALNMSEEAVVVELPVLSGIRWHLAVDTSRPGPDAIREPAAQHPIGGSGFSISGQSVVVLEGRRTIP